MSEGRKLLHALKAAAGSNGPAVGLRVGGSWPVFLRPVGTSEAKLNPQDVQCLTQWRNKYVTSFLNEFDANDPQTSRWLANVVGPDDTRILFMLDDDTGRTFGYMGLAFIQWDKNYVEADAIVR
ncbi:MAG: N-acetyltransferase, partial [Verrucomicrobiales bacterium]